MNRRMGSRLWWLGILSIGILLAAAVAPPIPQPLEYHRFADERPYFGIPNFFNVVSNLIFLVIGIAGLGFLWSRHPSSEAFIQLPERWPYLVLFLSVALAGIGSAYYHLAPDNSRLVWDRLPMAAGFMALLAATLDERIAPRVGIWLLPVLVAVGAASVGYWAWSEQRGAGNLNFYIVVQFYSLLVIILLCKFFPSRYTRGRDIYIALAWYGVAKMAEIADKEIYGVAHVVSGHTLKHVFAGCALYWLLRMLKKRRPLAKKTQNLGFSCQQVY